ncbi:SLATT domain-containing protein [Streptomyces cadmiisoli]|uniref:SLATT domain-containing protein n=1 Tax=Streptomyces cadmiisoli TaxID=2184053 RepID=UPI003648DE83
MAARRIPDLKLSALPDLPETADARVAALSRMYRHTESYALQAIDWYLAKRRRPSQWSKLLRGSAVCSAVLGGIVPLVHSASPGLISPDWGFVLLALGAGCVLVDRVFGHSSSWTRFTRAGLALQHALARAQTDWLALTLSLETRQPAPEDHDALLSVVRALQADVRTITEDETTSWVGYLTDGLDELASTTSRGQTLTSAADRPPTAAGRLPGPPSPRSGRRDDPAPRRHGTDEGAGLREPGPL